VLPRRAGARRPARPVRRHHPARAWWRGPQQCRVDALTLVGRGGHHARRAGRLDLAQRRPPGAAGARQARRAVPDAADLLAPTLGRRLAGTQDVELSALPTRRVAGRAAAGVRLVPRDPGRTMVRAVDLWAEPTTGLPLRVEVRAQGEGDPVLTAVLLDLDLGAPSESRTAFRPPQGAAVSVEDAPDVAALAERFAPYALPDVVAGLRRGDRSAFSGEAASAPTATAHCAGGGATPG
jgi:hypothetical protein